jgi:hypothetical protein
VPIILCPGIHDPALTADFWSAIESVTLPNTLLPNPLLSTLPAPYIVPDAQYWGFSPAHILQFLHQNVSITQPLVIIGFSAGVVGMAGAAWAWQQQGGTLRALIALDGWGVPLYGSFPIYRLSHDAFTHWSSQALGMGQDAFYADPGVAHLDLWRSPQVAWGWWGIDSTPQWVNAAIVVRHLLSRHCERSASA